MRGERLWFLCRIVRECKPEEVEGSNERLCCEKKRGLFFKFAVEGRGVWQDRSQRGGEKGEVTQANQLKNGSQRDRREDTMEIGGESCKGRLKIRERYGTHRRKILAM